MSAVQCNRIFLSKQVYIKHPFGEFYAKICSAFLSIYVLLLNDISMYSICLHLSIFSQLSQIKSFSKGQVYASATDSLTGQVSLEEFSRLLKEQEQTDELRQFGLTDEEISLKLKHDELMHNQV